MSAGARCLTSNIPENTAVTGDFGSSFISGDTESLTEVCRRLLAEPDENPRAEEQMEMIRRKYSYDRMILQTEQVYEKVRKV